jgi:hypothetical protein
MTIAEIIYTLEQKLQILGSNVYSNLLPGEILLQFDNVVDRYIDACLSPKPEGSLLGIADTQLKVDNLRLLKVPETILTKTTSPDNKSAYFTLPTNYRNLINDSSEVLICGVATWVGNRQIGDEEVKENIEENPFLKAKAWSPTSRIIGNTLLVTTVPGNIASRAKIDYFKKPTRLYDEYVANSNDSFQFADFPRNVQELFIDLLRNRFLETFESQRLPGAIQETNNFGTITNI